MGEILDKKTPIKEDITIGNSRLIRGDCLEVLPELIEQGLVVDYSFTSPPYNRKRNDKYESYDDTISNYYGLLKDATNYMNGITKNNSFINIQKNFYNKKEVFKYIGDFSKELYEIFIWEKSNPMPASGFSITNAYEFIFCFGNSLKSNYTYTKNHLTTSVNSNTNKKHKAIMNKKVSDFFIQNFTKENDVVLDCFMGLATTAISCQNNNRSFIGIEISKEYFDMSVERVRENLIKEGSK